MTREECKGCDAFGYGSPMIDDHIPVCKHEKAELKTFMDVRGWCNNVNMPVVKMWMPLPKPQKDGENE